MARSNKDEKALAVSARLSASTRASKRAAAEQAELKEAENIRKTVRPSKEKALKKQVWLEGEPKSRKRNASKASLDVEGAKDSVEKPLQKKRIRGADGNAGLNTTKQKPARRVLPRQSDETLSSPIPPKPVVIPPKQTRTSKAIARQPASTTKANQDTVASAEDSGDDSDEYEDNEDDEDDEDSMDDEGAEESEDDEGEDNMLPSVDERPTWVQDCLDEEPEEGSPVLNVPGSPSPSLSSDGAAGLQPEALSDTDLQGINNQGSDKKRKSKKKGGKKVKANQRSTGARQHGIEQERPRFKMPETQAQAIVAAPSETAAVAAAVQIQAVQDQQPDEDDNDDILEAIAAVAGAVNPNDLSTDLVFNDEGKLNLRHQHPIVEKVLVNVINKIITDFAFDNAIYAVDARFEAQRAIAVQVATSLGHPDVAARLLSQADILYAKEIVGMADHRVVLLRGHMKKTATSVVGVVYQLAQGAAAPRVSALLQGLLYAVPGAITNHPNGNGIFDVDIITQIIATHFFQVSPRSGLSIAQRNEDRFVSSIPTRPDELEIPEAMLAMACVAIYSALSDWSTGTFTRSAPFNIGAIEHEYELVLQSLASIKARSVVTYHRLMHKVYLNVSTYNGAAVLRRPQPGAVQGVLQRIAFDD